MGKIKRLYKTDRAQDFDHEQVRSHAEIHLGGVSVLID
jgi:hypothetical protein